MNKEEKQLLFKDLCARLPYGVKLSVNDEICVLVEFDFADLSCGVKHSDGHLSGRDIEDVKPYLRPMSSMTPEEEKEVIDHCCNSRYAQFVDFCNEHHLDYRDLIENNIVLEAPEGMYN